MINTTNIEWTITSLRHRQRSIVTLRLAGNTIECDKSLFFLVFPFPFSYSVYHRLFWWSDRMICLFKSSFEVNFSQRHLTTNGEIAYCQKLMSTMNLDGRNKSKTQKGEFLAKLLVQFLSVLIEPFFLSLYLFRFRRCYAHTAEFATWAYPEICVSVFSGSKRQVLLHKKSLGARANWLIELLSRRRRHLKPWLGITSVSTRWKFRWLSVSRYISPCSLPMCSEWTRGRFFAGNGPYFNKWTVVNCVSRC